MRAKICWVSPPLSSPACCAVRTRAVYGPERLANFGPERAVLAAHLEQELVADRKAPREIEIGPHQAIQGSERRSAGSRLAFSRAELK